MFSGNTANLLDWSCDGSGSGGQGWYDLCIAADPTDAEVLFIGGVNTWKSTDAGSSWDITNHWSSTCGGQATTVHADKHYLEFQNGTSVLFECNDGGLYKTINSGNSWTHISNTMVISQMYRLGVAQTVSNDVICGLQDNGTKSFDSNVWEDVIGGDGMECIVDYTNANTQYGSLYYGDIKRTTNHWNNYTTISNGISGSGAWITPYTLDPNNNQTIYVGYDDVWKSTNQGNNWSKISTWNGDNLQSLTVAPSNSLFIYAATYSTIYKTAIGGNSWSNITSNLPVFSSSITYISVKNDDPNTIWVSLSGFNGDGVYKTTNGGTSWTNISSGLPQIPVNCVIQNKLNTDQEELYAATDVGVYVKLGNANWVAFYDGLPNVVVDEIEIYYDESTPYNSLIRAATFGRGLWESDLYSSVSAPITDFEADKLTPTIIDTVYFTDLSTNSPTSWAWEISPDTYTFIEGTDANSQNPIAIFDVPGLYTVSLTATNAGGSNSEEKADYIEVMQLAPVSNFEADNTNPSTNMMVNFTDLSLNEPSSWLWEFNPTTISYEEGTDANTQNPILKFNEVGFYTVTLTSTNDGGSGTETKTDYIEVYQGLSITVNSNPENICLGESSQLNAEAFDGTGSYTYLWSAVPEDPSLVGQETIPNPIVSPFTTTTYTIVVNDGVENITDGVLITVNNLPEITLGNWPETLCNQLEPPVQLTASPEGGIFTGNVSESGLFSPETSPLGWNLITYTYVDENSCENSAQDSIFVDNCVGITNISADIDLNIYPNPNSGSFNIESTKTIKKIEFVNQIGKMVYSKSLNTKTASINAELSKGSYFIRVYFNDGSIIHKQIIIN